LIRISGDAAVLLKIEVLLERERIESLTPR
jgi:hypothetical protein